MQVLCPAHTILDFSACDSRKSYGGTMNEASLRDRRQHLSSMQLDFGEASAGSHAF